MSDYRPCLVGFEKALFHQFVETEQLILIPDKLPLKHQPLKHYTIEDHIVITNNCSVEKLKAVAAIVEFKDGDVAMVDVETIQFWTLVMYSMNMKFSFVMSKNKRSNKND